MFDENVENCNERTHLKCFENVEMDKTKKICCNNDYFELFSGCVCFFLSSMDLETTVIKSNVRSTTKLICYSNALTNWLRFFFWLFVNVHSNEWKLYRNYVNVRYIEIFLELFYFHYFGFCFWFCVHKSNCGKRFITCRLIYEFLRGCDHLLHLATF